MNKNLRNALRLSAYIRALGSEPITFHHGNHFDYARDLHRQHERLRQCLDPALVKAAQASARARIRHVGYRRAAEETPPFQKPASIAGNALARPGDVAPAIISPAMGAASAKERKQLRNDTYLCRRKLRHPNYWTAVMHALQLGKGAQTYECWVCGGIHVGHAPDDQRAQRYRQARRRLREIEDRLAALDLERKALVRERSDLVKEVGW